MYTCCSFVKLYPVSLNNTLWYCVLLVKAPRVTHRVLVLQVGSNEALSKG